MPCRISSIMNTIGQGYTSQKGDDYIKFSNGLIVQWGNYIDDAYQTFSVAFSNTDYGIGLTRISNVYGQVAAGNKSTTGFQPDGNQHTGSWIAIGY